MDQSKADITDLSTKKIDKDSLDVELLKEKKKYEAQLNQINNELKSKINALQTKINALGGSSTPETSSTTTTPKDISEKNIDEEP